MARRDAPLRAVIFDVDGTLAETERDGHRPSFNRAFAELGLPHEWDVDTYGALLSTPGGRQRIERYLLEVGEDPARAAELAARTHRRKTEYFRAWVREGDLRARPGVAELMRSLVAERIEVAIATTGTRAWVEPLLARLFGDIGFAAVVTGSDVTELKPHPAAYLEALARTGVEPYEALAVEDSPPGLASALAAGVPTLVVTSVYHRHLPFPGAAAVVPGYRAEDWTCEDDTDAGDHPRGLDARALMRLHADARASAGVR